MESKLFSFEGCDGDVVEMRYFDVTLNSDIGEFKTGHFFVNAVINFEKSHLSLYQEGQGGGVLVGKYELELRVAKDLLNEE